MKTAVIIGAGPAGLTAAYELLVQSDMIPILIEADKQVGGIAKTINYKNNRIDLGGHRFFSKSDKIIDWWLQFLSLEDNDHNSQVDIHYQQKSKNFSFSAKAENAMAEPAMMIRKRKSRIYYQKKFFDYPLQLNFSVARKLGFSKMLHIVFSYAKSRIIPHKEEKTLAQFFENRFGKELYETFFKSYTEKVWGVKCEDLPASWGYQRVKDLSIGKALWQAIKSIFTANTTLNQKGTSTSLIEQFLYPQYGPGQMWEKVAAEIKKRGGEIHLNAEVIHLVASADHVIQYAEVKDKNSGDIRQLKGDFFISTMPVKQLITTMKHPLPDTSIINLADGLEYREFIIVGILLKTAIKDASGNKDILKDNWIYLQDSNIKAGRLQLFNNWSPFMVNDPSTMWLGVEYFCSAGDGFWEKSEEEIGAIAIREMEIIGFIKQEDVLDHTVIKVEKAYPSYTGTYDRFEEIKKYLNKFSNLYPVGRNGMHRYNNTDHSMMTAMIAVNNIIENVTGKENIWSVNMEEDYHEEG